MRLFSITNQLKSTLSIRVIIALYAFCFCMAFFAIYFSQMFYSEKYFFDANHISRLAELPYALQLFSPFENTSLVYHFFGLNNVVFFQKISLLLFFIYLLITARDVICALIFTVLFSPCMIYLSIPTKEIIVGLFFVALVFFQNSSNRLFVGVISVFLFSYALLFRNYYCIIGLIFITRYLIAFLNELFEKKIILILGSLVTFFVFLVFKHQVLGILDRLVNIRNHLSLFRMGSDSAMSAFVNHDYTNYTTINFLMNYIVSAFHMLFPWVFYLNFKSLVLFILNLVTFNLCYLQLRSSSFKQRALAWLFLSHFFTSVIFEPDLGSYIRHQSVFMFVIIFPLIDNDRFRQFFSLRLNKLINFSNADMIR